MKLEFFDENVKALCDALRINREREEQLIKLVLFTYSDNNNETKALGEIINECANSSELCFCSYILGQLVYQFQVHKLSEGIVRKMMKAIGAIEEKKLPKEKEQEVNNIISQAFKNNDENENKS